MLECRACTWRAIRAIAGDAFPTTASATRPLALTPHILNPRRIATTARRSDETTPPKDALSKLAPIEDTQKVTRISSKGGAIVIKNEKAVRLELVHLKDPVKLAQHVQYTLRSNKPEKALDLCRLASKDMEVIVSWNHVIDWNIQNDKLNEAVRILNEMKKRGQFPDSYTYTRIFAGIAKSHRAAMTTRPWRKADLRKDHVQKALAIYHGMFSPTSRVKPNIIHTNAVLRICSLGKDMDAAWGVASKLEASGPGSANHITYSILLGAILECASLDTDPRDTARHVRTLTHAQLKALYQQKNIQAINDGKRIWEEIMTKWRTADLVVDERLVVGMARLLLISHRMQDWDDVLNLVQQTTRIDRLVPPLKSPERHSQHVPVEEEDETLEEDEDGWTPTLTPDAFKPVTPLRKDGDSSKKSNSPLAVQPGNGILNVVIEACTKMREPKTAQAYWDKITIERNVEPDLNNFQAVLGLLKINRSAARAVNLVENMHDQGMEVRIKTYRIAMATCQRDWKNHQIVDITTRLLDDMEKRSAYPDVSVLESYLAIALQTAEGPKIVRALDRLDSFVHVIRSRITYGTEGDERQKVSAQVRMKAEAAKFLQTMIGAIDVLMHRGLVPRDEFKRWHARRGQLSSFVGRAINNLSDQRRNVEAKLKTDEDYADAEKAWKEEQDELIEKGEMPKRPKPTPTRIEKQASMPRSQRRSRDVIEQDEPFAFREKNPVPDGVIAEQIRKWRAPQVRVRLDGLSKWHPPQHSGRELRQASKVREAHTERLYELQKQQRDAEPRPVFEAADSPMELATK